MRAYQFLQRCHPRNDLRAGDVAEFLRLMGEAFYVRFWTHRGKKVTLLASAIEKHLRFLVDPKIPGAGATWTLASDHVQNPLIVGTSTGSDEWGRDMFDIDFSRRQVLPDLSYFRRAIDLCKPFEAFIADNKNELDLASVERQRRFPNFERPSIVRWFHYLDKPLVDALGGLERCLTTPAFKTERFCNGVLLQLTEGPFEADNPSHTERQRSAMRHLDVD